MNQLKTQIATLVSIASILYATTSCESSKSNENGQLVTISMDLDNREVSDIGLFSLDTLHLDNSDEALVFRARDILFNGDNICIWGPNKAIIYTKDGKFINQLGTQGRGPGEYLNLNAVYVSDGKYYISDFNDKKLLEYDNNGEHLSTNRFPESTRNLGQIVEIGNSDKYVSLNTWSGKPNEIPLFSIYDSSLTKISSSERTKNSGLHRTVPFSRWKDEVLYSPLFTNDTLTTINKTDEIYDSYYIDFGDYRLPSEIDGSTDFADIMKHANKQENLDKYAVLSDFAAQNDKYLYFTYVYKKKLHLMLFDKEKKEGRAFRLFDHLLNEHTNYQFFTIHNDICYFVMPAASTSALNPIILKTDIKNLLKI